MDLLFARGNASMLREVVVRTVDRSEGRSWASISAIGRNCADLRAVPENFRLPACGPQLSVPAKLVRAALRLQLKP